MLLRIFAVVSVLAIVVFCFKDWTFRMLMAPSQWDFVTYRYIEKFLHGLGSSFTFNEYHVNLIATELSSQFMTHVTAALLLGTESTFISRSRLLHPLAEYRQLGRNMAKKKRS